MGQAESIPTFHEPMKLTDRAQNNDTCKPHNVRVLDAREKLPTKTGANPKEHSFAPSKPKTS